MEKSCSVMGLAYSGARTEEEALIQVREGRKFDITLMDIHVDSGPDGYEIARKILKLFPEARIVSFSANPIEERQDLGEGIMVDHFEKNGTAKYLAPQIYKVLKPSGKM